MALFHRIRGLLAVLEPVSHNEGLADLDEAIRLFAEIGNEPSASYVTNERQRISARFASVESSQKDVLHKLDLN